MMVVSSREVLLQQNNCMLNDKKVSIERSTLISSFISLDFYHHGFYTFEFKQLRKYLYTLKVLAS